MRPVARAVSPGPDADRHDVDPLARPFVLRAHA
jgi:hypothetical protein